MKKSELAILSVLILAAVFVFNGKINKVTNPCVQDYVAGQGNIRGNVNVEDWKCQEMCSREIPKI